MEQRRALKTIDPNRAQGLSSKVSKAKKGGVWSKTKTARLPSNAESKAGKPPVAPPAIVEKEQTAEEIKARFDAVARNRVSQDVTGLAELGIQEWSVDDFEHVRTLGSGGSATVFGAKEKQSGYAVALKVQDADEDDGLAEAEIDIHESLDHPSIVNMIDYFYSDAPFGPQEEQQPTDSTPERFLYMILELCDGGSLYDAIRCAENGRLCERQAAAYAVDALSALEHLHEQDIIMCDCKTANFLVSGNELKLADFGMAVRNDEREVIGGSPAYMAPEHLLAWREFNGNFDHRVDIYGLGVVLFEILCGELPFNIAEDDESSKVSFEARFENFGINDDVSFTQPILDLRKLNDQSADERFDLPPLVIPSFVSGEAKDLILRLMQPRLDKRISLSEAKRHSWFQKYL